VTIPGIGPGHRPRRPRSDRQRAAAWPRAIHVDLNCRRRYRGRNGQETNTERKSQGCVGEGIVTTSGSQELHTEFRTGAGIVRAGDGISYTVEPGETVAIVGESGSGKSVSALSLLRLIADPPGRITSGEILFAGRDIMQLPAAEMREIRGGEIGMVFQEPMTSLNPVLTIGRQITETLEQHRGMTRAASHRRAIELLRLVGIADADA